MCAGACAACVRAERDIERHDTLLFLWLLCLFVAATGGGAAALVLVGLVEHVDVLHAGAQLEDRIEWREVHLVVVHRADKVARRIGHVGALEADAVKAGRRRVDAALLLYGSLARHADGAHRCTCLCECRALFAVVHRLAHIEWQLDLDAVCMRPPAARDTLAALCGARRHGQRAATRVQWILEELEARALRERPVKEHGDRGSRRGGCVIHGVETSHSPLFLRHVFGRTGWTGTGTPPSTMFAKVASTAALRGAARAFSTRAAPVASRASPLALAAAGVAGVSLFAFPQVQLEGPRTIAGEYQTAGERSFIMIKPDGVSRQIVGRIIDRFEQRGYKLVAIKSVVPTEELARKHYSDLSERPFFPSLVKYITQGTPVIAMVWEGKDVIRQGRRMVGATKPLEADPGSIRGQYCVSVGRNIIHASDGFDSATKEIGLWFNENEIAQYEPAAWAQIMADN